MAAANKTSTITLSLRDSFTGPLKAISAATSGFQRQMTAVNASIAATSASLESASMRLTAALSIPAGLGIAKAAGEFGQFEDATIDAKRAIDGFTDETADRFKKLSREIGASFSETFAAAAEAGKAGLTDTRDIEQFLRLSRKVAVAFELPGEEAASQLMALKNGFQLTLPELEKFADQVNKIADSSSTTVPEMINFSARIAPAATLLGINRELAASFGAVGLSAGISAERMATGFNRLTQTLVVGAGATADQLEAFSKLKIDPIQLATLASTDATAATDQLINALANVTDSAEQTQIAMSLLGRESYDEILAVVGNLGELNRLRNTATTSSAGSVDAEYQRRQEAMTNALDRARASFKNLGATIGERFAPQIKQITALVERFNNYLIETPEAIDRIAKSLAGMVAAAPGLFIVAKSLRLVGLALTGLSLLTAPLARIGALAGLAAAGFGRSGRAAFGARKSFLALGASTLKTAAGFGLVGLAGYALYKSLPGIGRAFAALKTDIDLSAAMSSASTAFDALMDGRPEMAARHAGMAFDSILKAGKRLGANLKVALGEGWDLAVAELDKTFPSFKGFRGSVSGLAESIGGLFKSLAGVDTGDTGSKIQSLGKSLADASLRLSAAVLRTLASAIDALSDAIDRFNAAAPEGGFLGGLKAAFDGLPAVGKLLVMGAGFKVFAASAGTLIGVGKALRGLSFAKLITGLGKLGALKLSAIGYGLAELGKSFGLLSKDVDSGTVAAAFMALPVAIDAARLAASGGRALAGWAGAGAKAAAQYIGSFKIAQAIGTAISAAWNGLKAVVARWAGLTAGAAYAAGAKLATVIGAAISAVWNALKTAAATAAGTAAGGAYQLAVKAAAALAGVIGAAWRALTTVAAKLAGGAAGGAYAGAVKVSEKLSSSIGGAWSGLKTGAANSAGRRMGNAFRNGLRAAGAFAAFDLIASIPSGTEEIAEFMRKNAEAANRLSDTIDDAIGFTDKRNAARRWLGLEPIEQPTFPTAPAAANDNAPPVIEQPAFPASPQAQELGGLLNQIHDNAANIPSVTIETPQINVAPAPAATINAPGQAAPGGFGTIPRPEGGADLSMLKSEIGTLKSSTAAELSSLRASVDQLNATSQAGNSTLAGQTGILQSIDRGIGAGIKVALPWNGGGQGAGKAASSAPAANLPTTGFSSGPQ